MTTDNKKPVLLLWILALGGYIPFIFFALLSYVGKDIPLPLPVPTLFAVWSIAILSFLGGVRWGIAIVADPVNRAELILSVMPCIIAWLSFAFSEGITILTLAALFIFQGGWDIATFNGKRLDWFIPIRIVLTVLVVVAHALVFSIYI